MKLKFKGKNFEINENLREIAEKKIGKLDKYFREDIEGQVTFSQVKNLQICEVTIFLPGTIIRAEEQSDDMVNAIDRIVDALEKQVRKHKTKLQKRYNSGETIRFEQFEEEVVDESEEVPSIVRVKRFGLKPMSVEEAILQMELLGHNFFVFLEAEQDIVQVIYRRKDGNYGLIEPEF